MIWQKVRMFAEESILFAPTEQNFNTTVWRWIVLSLYSVVGMQGTQNVSRVPRDVISNTEPRWNSDEGRQTKYTFEPFFLHRILHACNLSRLHAEKYFSQVNESNDKGGRYIVLWWNHVIIWWPPAKINNFCISSSYYLIDDVRTIFIAHKA
jgi:hypothetical protein